MLVFAANMLEAVDRAGRKLMAKSIALIQCKVGVVLNPENYFEIIC